MKAVLVGTIGDDKVYYILDAGPEDEDCAVEREDGGVAMVDFMSFVSNARGLKKLRSSKFHRMLWDSPKKMTSGSWYEMFIAKSKEPDEKLLENSIIYSSLGKQRKKINKINTKALDFRVGNKESAILGKSANASMVKFNKPDYSFSTPQQRQDAWAAMCLLREIEENGNA